MNNNTNNKINNKIIDQEPLSNIVWIDSADLIANSYNPNIVFTPELKLLETSILETGWVQAILINKDNIIIDGFHRHMLSKESKRLRQKYNGLVPCAVLDVGRAEAMILTVRMNRAKGSHVAARMSEMIKELIDVHKVSVDTLIEQLGATKKEIDLLYQEGVFKARNLDNYKYSKSWKPIETGSRTNEETTQENT